MFASSLPVLPQVKHANNTLRVDTEDTRKGFGKSLDRGLPPTADFVLSHA
jgi:hypothetical protein